MECSDAEVTQVNCAAVHMYSIRHGYVNSSVSKAGRRCHTADLREEGLMCFTNVEYIVVNPGSSRKQEQNLYPRVSQAGKTVSEMVSFPPQEP